MMRERIARPVEPLPAWIALWTATAAHAVAFALSMFVLVGGQGELGAGGEGGISGAGGDTIEVTVLASRARDGEERDDETVSPSEADAEAEPERAPEPASTVLVAPESPGRDRVRVRETRRDAPEREHTADRPTAEPQGTQAPAADSQTPPTATIASAGDSDANRSGRAAGDAEAAAAILGSVGLGGAGPGARVLLERTCDDPIEGVWVSHRYRPGERQWARFTLRIEREGDALRGTIMSRMWSGFATDRRPPPCSPGGRDQTYRMVASGTIRGDEFSFGASSYQLVRTDCPADFAWAYYPDRFSGTVDTLHEELDSVNNDGFADINAPYTFRRTSCLDE